MPAPERHSALSANNAPTAFEKLAKEIAKGDVFDAPVLLAHNSKLYMVEKNWKSSIIEESLGAERVQTLSELERAICDSGVEVVYIPSNALISLEGIKRVCQRNAASKTILKEVDDE